jgi:magnesium transporter
MVSVLVYRDGAVEKADVVDPLWLAAGAAEVVWLDLDRPGQPEAALLRDVFQIHEVAIEDALAEVHHPKIETYGHFLYLILHAIEAGPKHEGFVTHDVDFFLGRNFLITVHQGPFQALEALEHVCERHPVVMSEGPGSLLHRLVDRLVAAYNPEVDALEARIEKLEAAVFRQSRRDPLREIIGFKGDVASLRRVTRPQRDAISRLARREFPQVNETLTYRFRDVYDQLVRLSEAALFLQDRVTGLLDAYLSLQSNRLNQVMKVLTVIATIFMPLTVVTGLYGMNVPLPAYPGAPPTQFWWIVVMMLTLSLAMLWVFRRKGWL